jgi:hypothetical protein
MTLFAKGMEMRTSIKSIGGLLLVAFTLGSRVAQAQVLSRSNPLANAHGLWISIESQDFQSMKSIDFLGSGKVAIQGLGEGTFEFLKNQQYRLRFDGNGVKLCQVAVTSTGNQEMTIIAVADENGKIVDKCELGKIAFKFDSDATSEIQEKGAMGQGAPEDLQALSCRASEVGDAIRQGKLVVPKTLYHFGGKSSLLKNVENNGILESDWDNHIMSGKSRFDLKPFRRGFYGGADTNDISLYSFVKPDDYPFNKSARLEWSWLTKFTLRDECRTPDRVTTLVGLPKNPVFQNWFLKTLNKEGFQSVQAIADVCFVGDDFNPDTVEETSSSKPTPSF